MEKIEEKFEVSPFKIRVVSENRNMVLVEIPEAIVVNGKQENLTKRHLLVDQGRNPLHNIRRDVRAYLRKEEGILISFKRQDEIIII